MPEKQYFTGIDVKKDGSIIDSIDAKDSEARADLADLEDYVESIAPVALSITENGTYTAPTGVFGYSPVTVDTDYHLPDGYTQLDYVETPSSGQAGFEITGYTATDYDIHETKTMPYRFGAEAGFCGCDNGSALELYYTSSGDLKVYSLDSCIDLIGSRSASLNNAYVTKAMIKSTYKSGFKIGYYKLQNYPFYGRIYYYNVYRPARDVENITLLYNFIPCKRNSDNKIGFYDAVNDTFYSSTTGTEFVAPASV